MAMDAGLYKVSANDAYRALERIRLERLSEIERAQKKFSQKQAPKPTRTRNLSSVVDEPIYLISTAGSVVIVPAGTEIVYWQGASLAHAPEEFPTDLTGSAWCTMFDYAGKKQVTVYSLGGVQMIVLDKKPSINYDPIPWTQQ